MFCEHCGNKLIDSHKFCTKCGRSTIGEGAINNATISNSSPDPKWWLRLLKVIYILLYFPLIFVLPLTWDANSYMGISQAYWYSLLVLVIYLLIMKLIRIAFLYIALAQKPRWGKEIKKLIF